MVQPSSIKVFKTIEELTDATAKFIIEVARHTIEAKGRFVIALSGGNTPEQLYILLTKQPFCDQIEWDRTFIFWGDERCVPLDDKKNNAYTARLLLLDKIQIPAANINPIPVDLSPVEAAIKYESTINEFFGENPPAFDLILLGLGENGHTASLFPGTDVIHENVRIIKEVYVPEQKMFRVTMTAKLINQADNVLFLVAGAGKADIFKIVQTSAYQPDRYPAQLIKPVMGNLYWFVDKQAAALMPA
ncbi:MAG: 6-phosphogluconolactonase [Taibaiella sp.]|nr:6-phosphogluconolactonase [Taibaiella sp.]